MSRRGAVLAANAATAQRGLAGNSQGAAMAPGSAPSGLLQTLGINSSSGQTLQHTGGWGDAYGGGSLPRPPATFTDGAYGPFSPIIPAALDEGEPPYGLPPARREQYRVGWNLPTGEPGAEGLKLCSFETLRSLADLYSVARACIQYLKTEITSLEWDIMPTRDAAKTMKGSKSQALDFGKRRAEAVGFFRRPDPDYFSWQTWLSAVLEEMLVYDALSLVIRQKWGKGMGKGLLGGDLDSLQLISGSTVRPLYDIHGATPRPPAPAYQQYLYGVPRVDLMTVIMERDIEEAEMRGSELGSYHGDQLLYLPVTPRRWTPYGFSPIERGLIPIISGLNKQAYALDFFTQGTVPAVYVSPGQDMSPTQIRELQTALNGITGDPAQHHRIIVLPTGSRTDPQRPTALADQFDEIIMSQVCMAFGVMPMQIGISPKVSTTQCYADGTEVLTRNGWKSFDHVSVGLGGDEFATRNPKTHAFEWQHATDQFEGDFSGELVTFTNRDCTLRVTPEHRMLLRWQDSMASGGHSGEFFKLAGDIRSQKVVIPATSDWIGSGPETVTFGEYTWSSVDFASFLGAWIAEGSLGRQYNKISKSESREIVLTQCRGTKGFVPYRDLLMRMLGREPGYRESSKSFFFSCSELWHYLDKLGKAHEKRIPVDVRNWDSPELSALLHHYLLGDGHVHGSGWRATTVSKDLADDLQELAQKLGMSASIGTRQPQTRVMRDGRVIRAENCRLAYIIGFRSGQNRALNVGREKYHGKVRCVSVPNTVLYVRTVHENGQVTTPVWCGNSPGAANQMAKASANNQDQGTLQPTLIFLATIMERVLAVMCGQTDMRFMFDGMQEEEDEETTTNLVVNQTTHALTTIDEGREQLGKEPYGIPESSEPGFLVATGWMPLAGSAAAAEAQREQAAAPPPAPIIGDPNLTRQALTAPNGQPPKSLTQKKPAAQQSSGSKKTPAQTANAQAAQANTTSQASAQGAQQERRANPAAATKVADTVQPDIAPNTDTEQPPPPTEATTLRDALVADVGAALAKQLMGIMLDLYAGKVSLLQAVASAVTAMGGGYRHVLGHASNAASRTLESTPPLPDHVLDDLAATLGEQQRQYVTGMAQATVNASTQAADLTWLPARTRMYGSTLNGAWNNGFGDTVEDAHPDYKIIWTLGETEHCDLCLVRDGQEFTFDTLPGFPGDGGFGGDLCEGGPLCGCALVYKEGDKVLHQVENAQRPEAIAYYAQQRQDIVAARAQLAADQAAFAASLPAKVGQDGTSARSRAMNRDDLRNELARLANQRIRQAGGYSGVSVEPQDIPAVIIASLLPQYGPQPDVSDLPITALMDAVESMFVGRYSTMDITKSAFTALMLTSVVDLMRATGKTASDDDRRVVQAEMEACARHLVKGRAVTDWRREHLTIADVATLADLVHTGALTRAECVKTAMDRRHVLIDGTIVEPEIPQASLVQGSAAGGGGYVLLAHDEYGIQHDDDMSSPHPRPNATKVGPKGYTHGWIHVGDAVDSLGMHTDSGGNVTAKRAALHDKLINATLAGHESEEHPVATFLGGGPASGKTSVMRDTKGMVIAADDLKFQLPEYKKMLKNGDKRAAAFTHEESSHMTGNLVKEASKRKVSFVLDGLGDSGIDKLTKKVEGIRAAGHRVDAKYVTVDTEEAVRRAKARAAKTGFLVPETSMRASHAAVSRTFKAAIDRDLFDRAELWDNNGREPKLIGRKLPDGPWQVHDQAAWQKFLAKGQEA